MKKTNIWATMTMKDKLEHIWGYYRYHILIGVAVAFMLGSIVLNILTFREPDFYVVMIDAFTQQENATSGFDDFLETYDYKKRDTIVDLNTGLHFSNNNEMRYVSAQLLAATIATGDVDIFFWTDEALPSYIGFETLIDLSKVLPESLLTQYKDMLVYVTDENGESYPYAIHLQNNEWVIQNEYYMDCYVGIFCQAQNIQIACDFMQFILNE